MTPEQLQQTARLLRDHCPPPDPSMSPGGYVVSEAVYRLANAITMVSTDLQIDGSEEPRAEESRVEEPRVRRAERPPLDDEFLRREALDLSVRAQRGVEEGAVIVARAEILLGFLRGDPPSRASQEDAAWKAGER